MEQMIDVLKQAEMGVPVAEVIRKAGISEQAFYRWKAKDADRAVDSQRGLMVERLVGSYGYQTGGEINFSRPGKPTDNAFAKSFNGTFRSECLNALWFLDPKEARQVHWLSARSRIEGGYRQTKRGHFLSEQSTISDGFANASYDFTSKWAARLFVQHESLLITSFVSGTKHNESSWFQRTSAARHEAALDRCDCGEFQTERFALNLFGSFRSLPSRTCNAIYATTR